MLGVLADLLFPRACSACGMRGAHAWPFCSGCWARVAVLTPPGCLRCGRPLETFTMTCADCPPPGLAWTRAAFLYEGPVRDALMRLKFGRLRAVSEALAPWMLEVLARSPPARSPPLEGADPVITWVPLGRRRLRSRGYDQAEALARSVAKLTGWPVRRLLARILETPPQARHRAPERKRALRGAFRALGPAPARVVLVDDVLTSGATVAECARALIQAGAAEVGALTAARALGGAVPARCYNPAGLRPGSVVARERSSR